MAAKVGEYFLLETIGHGAFGKVKLGVHQETGERVAVKIMDKGDIQKQDLTQNVRREITIMKALNHNNIVRLYQVLTTSTKIYVVMELVTGGELFDVISKHRHGLKEKAARRYFQQLVDGVVYCHKRKVYHRDLKPENILLSETKEVKVTDFGLSSITKSKQGEKDERFLKTQCGTPCYVAPEVIYAAQEGYSGEKADGWACGVVLYALLTGSLPFDSDELSELFMMIMNTEPHYPDHLSKGAKDLLKKMLHKDPKKRIGLRQVRQHPWFLRNYEGEGDEGARPRRKKVPSGEGAGPSVAGAPNSSEPIPKAVSPASAATAKTKKEKLSSSPAESTPSSEAASSSKPVAGGSIVPQKRPSDQRAESDKKRREKGPERMDRAERSERSDRSEKKERAEAVAPTDNNEDTPKNMVAATVALLEANRRKSEGGKKSMDQEELPDSEMKQPSLKDSQPEEKSEEKRKKTPIITTIVQEDQSLRASAVGVTGGNDESDPSLRTSGEQFEHARGDSLDEPRALTGKSFKRANSLDSRDGKSLDEDPPKPKSILLQELKQRGASVEMIDQPDRDGAIYTVDTDDNEDATAPSQEDITDELTAAGVVAVGAAAAGGVLAVSSNGPEDEEDMEKPRHSEEPLEGNNLQDENSMRQESHFEESELKPNGLSESMDADTIENGIELVDASGEETSDDVEEIIVEHEIIETEFDDAAEEVCKDTEHVENGDVEIRDGAAEEPAHVQKDQTVDASEEAANAEDGVALALATATAGSGTAEAEEALDIAASKEISTHAAEHGANGGTTTELIDDENGLKVEKEISSELVASGEAGTVVGAYIGQDGPEDDSLKAHPEDTRETGTNDNTAQIRSEAVSDADGMNEAELVDANESVVTSKSASEQIERLTPSGTEEIVVIDEAALEDVREENGGVKDDAVAPADENRDEFQQTSDFAASDAIEQLTDSDDVYGPVASIVVINLVESVTLALEVKRLQEEVHQEELQKEVLLHHDIYNVDTDEIPPLDSTERDFDRLNSLGNVSVDAAVSTVDDEEDDDEDDEIGDGISKLSNEELGEFFAIRRLQTVIAMAKTSDLGNTSGKKNFSRVVSFYGGTGMHGSTRRAYEEDRKQTMHALKLVRSKYKSRPELAQNLSPREQLGFEQLLDLWQSKLRHDKDKADVEISEDMVTPFQKLIRFWDAALTGSFKAQEIEDVGRTSSTGAESEPNAEEETEDIVVETVEEIEEEELVVDYEEGRDSEERTSQRSADAGGMRNRDSSTTGSGRSQKFAEAALPVVAVPAVEEPKVMEQLEETPVPPAVVESDETVLEKYGTPKLESKSAMTVQESQRELRSARSKSLPLSGAAPSTSDEKVDTDPKEENTVPSTANGQPKAKPEAVGPIAPRTTPVDREAAKAVRQHANGRPPRREMRIPVTNSVVRDSARFKEPLLELAMAAQAPKNAVVGPGVVSSPEQVQATNSGARGSSGSQGSYGSRDLTKGPRTPGAGAPSPNSSNDGGGLFAAHTSNDSRRRKDNKTAVSKWKNIVHFMPQKKYSQFDSGFSHKFAFQQMESLLRKEVDKNSLFKGKNEYKLKCSVNSARGPMMVIVEFFAHKGVNGATQVVFKQGKPSTGTVTFNKFFDDIKEKYALIAPHAVLN